MVWSHYVNEVNLLTSYNQSDDEYDDEFDDSPLAYQDWITEHSDDLFNIWNGVNGYTEDVGISNRFLKKLDWNTFCEFCYNFSMV